MQYGFQRAKRATPKDLEDKFKNDRILAKVAKANVSDPAVFQLRRTVAAATRADDIEDMWDNVPV